MRGPPEKVEPCIFSEIDSDLIKRCIKRISGAGGPSGADAEMWLHILCTKQLKNKPTELCDAIADCAKKLATSYINPMYLEGFTACRLVPLDKNPTGIRPIGIGEILHRIIGKAIVYTINEDIVNATAPLQICAGVPGGVEAAVHAVREMYEDPNVEGILLVDAANAFNVLNRKVALHNISRICPELATYMVNTYRSPAKLYIKGAAKPLLSQEGTTQGDVPAQAIYSCSTMPLLHNVKQYTKDNKADVKQIMYADDAAAGGKIENLAIWWERILDVGPKFGYFPKPSKSWLIVKPGLEDLAKSKFPDLNITSVGHKYLGSFIGTEEGVASFMKDKIEAWTSDIQDLARIASTEPQLAYAAFVYGTSKKWQYVMRTTPNISHLFKPLEHIIQDTFIPEIVGKSFLDDETRAILALPARHGGMSIGVTTELADKEYENSKVVTARLTKAIINQESILQYNKDDVSELKLKIIAEKEEFFKETRQNLIDNIHPALGRQLELISEQGVSCILTTLPLKSYGFTMNKREFHDYVAFRYNFKLSDMSRTCGCNEVNSINHSLICKKGGYAILRHNSLSKVLAELLEEAGCKDVVTEPVLQDLTGEQLPSGSNTSPNARLDVSCRSFWTPLDKVFTDVRVFHAQAPSNARMSINNMYRHHENLKKTEYNARVLQVEKGNFSPIVFNTIGGMGPEANKFVKRLAERMSSRKGTSYSSVISFVRRRLRFDLMKTILISLRGFRGKPSEPERIKDLDIDLERQPF